MWNPVPSGTEGYSEEAEALVGQYESVSFNDVHAPMLRFLPPPAARVLDVGAGTGRDAAGFAALGYLVTAVEPTVELRMRAIRLHPAASIEWVDDCLPDLSSISDRHGQYDVVMLTAVWMHLDEGQRKRALPRVVALVRIGGLMMISLRHGPIPPGRRMFEVTAAEIIKAAGALGLMCIQHLQTQDGLLKRPGVTWDRLAFRRMVNQTIVMTGRKRTVR